MPGFLRMLFSTGSTPTRNIVLIGDSTIDNKLWAQRGQSVSDHLRRLLPNTVITDLTNAGFTTGDVLNGQYKDCVVQTSREYPHRIFRPLEHETEIGNANTIILSVGGNNIRDYLLSLEHNPFSIVKFDAALQQLVQEYQTILLIIKHVNPDAEIILMTQYYPALHQKSFEGINLYTAFSVLAPVLSIISLFRRDRSLCTLGGQNYMHTIINKMFNQILLFCIENNIRVKVVDVTSSLDPNDSTNYEYQIEPSSIGGLRMAQMLSYAVANPLDYSQSRGEIYRFMPEFFGSTVFEPEHVELQEIQPGIKYRALHPKEFVQPGIATFACPSASSTSATSEEEEITGRHSQSARH